MNLEDINNFENKFPFLTGLRHREEEFVGIVQNSDDKIVTFYDYSSINDEIKKAFLDSGEMWWWESNRSIPINIFMREEMQKFKDALKTFSWKETEHLFGPLTSIDDIIQKRIKRKQIQLIRKVD